MALRADTVALVARALELWQTVYIPNEIVPTVRQIFYALAVEEYVEKSDEGYSKVQRAMIRARERGDYPWEGIDDTLRKVDYPHVFEGPTEYFDVIRKAYRLDYWQAQPVTVEVWCEKDTIRGTVARVVDEYQVPLLIGRGYLSGTAKKKASERVSERPTVILYIGDHDPSGINMIEEATAWMEASSGLEIEVHRVAITDEDHEDQELPRLAINSSDSRSRSYRQRFGDHVIEVEALAPEVLQKRLQYAIECEIQAIPWHASKRLEKWQQEDLARRLG